MFVRTCGPLRIAEVWFEESPPAGADIAICRNGYHLPPGAAQAETSSTLLLDLTADAGAILRGFKPDCRYEIRRAEKDGVRCEFQAAPDSAAVTEFCRFHDGFARSKGRPPCSPDQLQRLRRQGALALSWALPAAGDALVWHAYVHWQGHTRLLHSASRFREQQESAQRSLIGRANRALHWADVRAFQALGCRTLDLGGWANDSEEQARISRFKEEFGGRRVARYDCIVGLTWLGRCAVRLQRVRGRWR